MPKHDIYRYAFLKFISLQQNSLILYNRFKMNHGIHVKLLSSVFHFEKDLAFKKYMKHNYWTQTTNSYT